ncbi:MAG TPA: hypothetical protein VHR45_03545 [Thermoanaerobaculia bacterium]|nr:hypothetical protein [Thermoanaerobaculia bacterium]
MNLAAEAIRDLWREKAGPEGVVLLPDAMAARLTTFLQHRDLDSAVELVIAYPAYLQHFLEAGPDGVLTRLPPTVEQADYARRIAETLNLTVPFLALSSRIKLNEFIDEHRGRYEAAVARAPSPGEDRL